MNMVKTDFLRFVVLINCVSLSMGYAAMPAASMSSAINIANKPAVVSVQSVRDYIAKSDLAAFNNVKGAIPTIEYRTLEELHHVAHQTKHKINILSQVSQANVWADFKQLIEQLHTQAQRAEQKKDQRGGLYYAEQYLEQEQNNPEATALRKQALQLMQANKHCALDGQLVELMHEAEKDPSTPRAYFAQAKRNAQAIYSALDDEYKKYTKVHFYDADHGMYGYKVAKKNEKKQSESICTIQ